MVDFGEAIKKPFSDLKTLGIGAVLSIIPIANLLVTGYVVKTAEDVMKKKNKLREWKVDDIVEYLKKWLISAIIGIVYLIVPAILVLIGVGNSIIAVATSYIANPTDMTAVINSLMGSLAVSGPILLVGAILGIIAVFLLPMAVMKWLQAGKINAAFNVIEVAKNALTADYVIALIFNVIYGAVLFVIAMLVGGILLLIPVIGIILSLLLNGAISFAVAITGYTLIAQTVKK
ncbi:MAG: DUF4013 domain-containing protein [archaeon]